jgi:hypothetical protein
MPERNCHLRDDTTPDNRNWMSKELFDDGPLRISEERNLIPSQGRTVVITNCHHTVRHRRRRKVTVIDATTTTRERKNGLHHRCK